MHYQNDSVRIDALTTLLEYASPEPLPNGGVGQHLQDGERNGIDRVALASLGRRLESRKLRDERRRSVGIGVIRRSDVRRLDDCGMFGACYQSRALSGYQIGDLAGS